MYTIFVYSISEGVNVPTVAGPIGLGMEKIEQHTINCEH